MRDTKFRAWDKKRNCWNYTLFELDADGEMIQADWFEMCQYTGLKDKNGKEIFEGELVRIIYKQKEEGVYEVAWDEAHCCFIMGRMLPDNSDADTVYFGNQFDYEYEVIGNIYESPDLLSKEQEVKATESKEKDG